ncbi:MAG TPA: prephenate dehydrogenase [Campylobacterales bacterium]|nr:prephenate dehydrogenase [Campylobacterales bacterium]HIP60809.1 prephenate dehydrogenase [Campylobacterales bacterium]
MVIGIVGLGLMGGSLGLALKSTMEDVKLVGFDHNKIHCEEANKLGFVDEIVSFDILKKSDVIILAIPVEAIIKTFENLKDIEPDTTIIDLGSTKAKIVALTPKEIETNLVAAHPMAGIEKFGPNAAFGELYAGQVVVLCDIEKNSPLHKQRAIDIFNALKMKIVYMNAKAHDLHAAYISHLPHAISYALANSVLKQEDPKSILALAAGGFRDMSRIAKSSPNMWSDIFQQNSTNLLHAIEGFERELTTVKKMIKEEDDEGLKKWMRSATTLHKIL